MKHKYLKKTKNPWLVAILVVALVAALVAGYVLILAPMLDRTPAQPQTDPTEGTAATEAATNPVEIQVEEITDAKADLGNGLLIRDIGSYTGLYMEDGSDEVLSGILMIMVTNNGDAPIQYAEITMTAGEQVAKFTLSTLPVGKSVVVLEQNRMAYDASVTYTDMAAQNVALFTEPLSLCEDKLKIQSLDGALNITNISGDDITGDIIIYYKNSSADMFYGGITYRVRLTGGLAANETRQIMSSHYSSTGSTIMFVTCY